MAHLINLTKKTIFLIFILTGFITTGTFAQYWHNPVRIDSADRCYQFHITTETIKPHLLHTYFWFNSGRLHRTDGGYDGKLLHGEYKVTDLNKRLLVKGNFHMGRKSGNWYTWHLNGKLKSLTRYHLRNERQTIEEYDAQGNLSKKGYYKKELFTGQQQEKINDTTVTVSYKNGIRKKEKNNLH